MKIRIRIAGEQALYNEVDVNEEQLMFLKSCLDGLDTGREGVEIIEENTELWKHYENYGWS